jgi:5,5'-dehydrodivanillate O-demethylase oxygenase subunit
MAAVEASTIGQQSAQAQNRNFAHTGPDTLVGRWLRKFWHPVFRAQDLAAGRAKPIRILNEDLTLYRGETGVAHVVAFRCAHRGTQLSTGWVEGDELRCFYHGWKYDASGQCTEQPAEPEPFCSRIKIRSYPTIEYLGLIFAYLGDGTPPPLRRFPTFEKDDEGVLEVHTYTWNCNVINSLENDPIHSLFVHRDTAIAGGRTSYPTITCHETEAGYDMHRTFPGRPTGITHRYMPNCGHNTDRLAPGVSGGREAVYWRVPVDDDHFVSFSSTLSRLTGEERARFEAHLQELEEREKQGRTPVPVLGEAVLRGEYRIEDIEGIADDESRRFNVQDYVSQAGQGRIDQLEQEHLGRTDATVILQRQIWVRELRALAEGRPLKSWLREDEPVFLFEDGESRKGTAVSAS